MDADTRAAILAAWQAVRDNALCRAVVAAGGSNEA